MTGQTPLSTVTIPITTNRCFYVNNTGAVVAGFTITNGHTDTDNGGGVYLRNGTVSNCVISGNASWYEWDNSTDGGGGIYMGGAHSAKAQLYNSDVYANLSSNSGGGIHMCCGTNLVANCYIYNNTVTNRSGFEGGGGGGGIRQFLGAIGGEESAISNCVIVSNVSCAHGGGVTLGRRSVIYHCRIADNKVYNGGAIDKGGGGVFLGGGAKAYNCLVVGNSSDGLAGGVHASDASLYSCTVSGNTGKYGGGIGIMFPSRYVNTIVCGNTQTYSGTNLWSISWAEAPAYFTNCYLGETNFPKFSSTVNTFTDCIVGQSPGFAGPGDYRLSAHSPCVNAGLNEAWMTGAVDLDKHSRIDRFSGVVDMGAYEFLPAGTIFIVH